MSANILVSNGTCYSSSGKKLDPAHFIPCGNAAFGHVTCCGVGDNCLAQNACFGYHGTGYGSALTYQVGCTDPSYSHSSCPDKKGIDQPWIALTLCDDSDGIWAPCPQEGSPSTLRPGSYCTCTDASKTTAAFDDNTVLANIASLPRTEGGSISFFSGHTPTAPPNTSPAETTGGGNGGGGGGQPSTGGGGGGSDSGGPSQTGTGSGPSITGTGANTGPAATSGTSTDPASSNNPSGPPNQDLQGASGDSSGLNSGAKIGIGIGAAVGGLILIATLVALFYFSRKRRRLEQQEMMETGEAPTGAGAGGIFGKKGHKQRFSDTSTIPSGVSEADGRPMNEADGKAVSKPWLGNRSELEGDNQASLRDQQAAANGGTGRNGQTLTPVAELPGSEPWPTLGR